MRYCHTALHDFVRSHSLFSPAKGELGEFGQSLEAYLVGIARAQSDGEAEEHDFLGESFGHLKL